MDENGDGQRLIDVAVRNLNALPQTALETVKRAIRDFNSSDISKYTSEEIASLVSSLAYSYFVLPYPNTSEFRAWRVRKSAPGELFAHTNDLRYPPNAATPGRIAHPLRPIFYAASSPETAFAEGRLQKGDFFHLTEYGVSPSALFQMAWIGDIDCLRRFGKTPANKVAFEEVIRGVLENVRPDVALSVELVDAFFRDWLGRPVQEGVKNREQESVYRVCNAIALELMNVKELSGLIYSSVQHEGGHNFALTADCYDQNITPIKVTPCYMLEELGYGRYQVGQVTPLTLERTPGPIAWPETEPYSTFRSLSIFAQELD